MASEARTSSINLPSCSDRDGRPAALFKRPEGGFFALAQLEPGGPWVEVDAEDVAGTAGLLSEKPSEDVPRREFGWSIGDAEVPTGANVSSFMPPDAAR